MATRRTAIRFILLIGLCVIAFEAQAQQIKPGIMMKARRDTASTGWIHTTFFDLDTANAIVRAYIIRLADSAAANRVSAVSPKDYEQFAGTINSLNGANDSINVALYGGIYHVHPNIWAQYLDRVSIDTDLPGKVGPSTWRNDLPPVGVDSCIIYRISRNASRPANARIWLTAYKVARGTGLSFANTVGVFYDALIFDEAQFKAVGAGNTQAHFQFSHKRVR